MKGLLGPLTDPLPAASPLHGLFWSVVVPALLFLVALGATWWLYRRFAGEHDEDR